VLLPLRSIHILTFRKVTQMIQGEENMPYLEKVFIPVVQMVER